jgi:DNA-binding transcriptional regulator YiaG
MQCCKTGGLMSFSEFVKEVRYNLKLSQQQLAQALNVNYTTINRWENGHVVPSNLAQKSFFEFCQDNFINIPNDLSKNNDR